MHDDSLVTRDPAEPVFLCEMPSKGKIGIAEYQSFVRIARTKAPFPAGGYIQRKLEDDKVIAEAIHDPNFTPAKKWLEYVQEITPDIMREVIQCGNMRRHM